VNLWKNMEQSKPQGTYFKISMANELPLEQKRKVYDRGPSSLPKPPYT